MASQLVSNSSLIKLNVTTQNQTVSNNTIVNATKNSSKEVEFSNDEIVQYGKKYEAIGQASRSHLVEKPDMQIEVSSLTVDED